MYYGNEPSVWVRAWRESPKERYHQLGKHILQVGKSIHGIEKIIGPFYTKLYLI